MISYRRASDLEERVRLIVEAAEMRHIDVSRVRCVRSYGSASRGLAARIHSASKAFFTGMGLKPAYVIEFVAEVFDNLPPRQQDEVILHELLHIPKSFGGGLVPHGRINFRKEAKTLRKFI